MSETRCSVCNRPDSVTARAAEQLCQLCHEPTCKRCTEFLAEGSFSFLKTLPPELAHSFYCLKCVDATVTPAREAYDAVMEEAKGVFVFLKSQKRPPRLLKKAKSTVQVTDCRDRDETILRLGFFAAQEGYNALVDVDVVAAKVRNEGYQKMIWRGHGTPAQVDGEKLDREDY